MIELALKERPILFKKEMVLAILAGNKTQTRRLVKPQPETNGKEWFWNEISVKNKVGALGCFPNLDEFLIALRRFCPYGKVGDRLWVKETFYTHPAYSAKALAAHSCGPLFTDEGEVCAFRGYSADGGYVKPFKQMSSLFMPRIASRILLEIVSVRAERVQSITRSDIRAEGLQCPAELCSDEVSPNYRDWYPTAWRELWQKINGVESWSANLWVWIIEFKRILPKS